MSRRFSIFASLSMGMIVACGGGGGGAGGGGGGGNNPDATGSTGPDATLGSGGQSFQVTWGPITVPAGVEDTQCVWLRLGNTEALKVNQIHNVLSYPGAPIATQSVSHHLIVYKDDMDTTEQTTPVNCQPFSGALNTTGNIEPLVITQKKDDLVQLPTGVAYTFNANQMVKIEFHYINSGESDVADVGATVNVISADPSTITDEAAILFNGSPDIGIAGGCGGNNSQLCIPAGATAGMPGTTLHEFLTMPDDVDLSHENVFAITGHEHHRGIGVQISTDASAADAGSGVGLTSIYDPSPFTWSEPATVEQTPPFSVPSGGGFDLTCQWDNTSQGAASFGESANDEMCFFWAYYYPAIVTSEIPTGSRVCIHTNQVGGANGLDVCCPSTENAAICSEIGNFLGN